jgi:hypothetical protein
MYPIIESTSITEEVVMPRKRSNYNCYLSPKLKKSIPKNEDTHIKSMLRSSALYRNMSVFNRLSRRYSTLTFFPIQTPRFSTLLVSKASDAIVSSRRKKIFSDVFINSNRHNTIDIDGLSKSSIPFIRK